MTVIAWDGKTLAADRRMGSLSPLSVTKIRRANRNGHLLGVSGLAGSSMEMLEWYESGADPEKFTSWHRDADKNYWVLIEIDLYGQIHCYYNSPTPVLVEDPRCAIGSGQDFAMAAMYLGKTSKEAVEVACALTAECGNGVDVLELNCGHRRSMWRPDMSSGHCIDCGSHITT